MTIKTLAIAAALLGTTALSAHAAVVGTQGFADIGTPSANTGNINTATSLTIGDLISTTASTGIFSGLATQLFGSVTLNMASPSSFTFGSTGFGTFTGSKLIDTINAPGALAVYVTGTWVPASSSGISAGPYDASFTITFNQTPAHTGAISDSATFSVPPAGGVIPEVSTWAMMGLGFAALGFAGYRSSRKSAGFAA